MNRTPLLFRIVLVCLALLAAANPLPACPAVPAVLLNFSESVNHPEDPPESISIDPGNNAFRLTGYFEQGAVSEEPTEKRYTPVFSLAEFKLSKKGLPQVSFKFEINFLPGQQIGVSLLSQLPTLPFGQIAFPRGFIQICSGL